MKFWKTEDRSDIRVVNVPPHKRVRNVEVVSVDGRDNVYVELEDRPVTTVVLASVDVRPNQEV